MAVAAASRTALGERVLIVDWDVHHGNGTQDIFWDDPDVLYVSTHQHPALSGDGRPDEVGGPAAAGLTLNMPLPPGATGDVVLRRARRGGPAAIEEFGPDWVLVSCGFDAHRDDPLGNLELVSGRLRRAGPRGGRVRARGPGGWPSSSKAATSATALRSSVTSTLGALLGRTGSDAADAGLDGGPGLVELREADETACRAPPSTGCSKNSAQEPVHEHGAVRVGGAVLADRADHHADELTVAPRAHDEEVGALRRLDQHGGRMPTEHPGDPLAGGVRGASGATAASMFLLTSSSGSKSSGSGTAQP